MGFCCILNRLVFITPMFWKQHSANPASFALSWGSQPDRGEADSTNYWSQRLTDSWHPLADFLSQSPTLNAVQKHRSGGSIERSFNQLNPHRWQGSTARTIIGCRLIIFEMITVDVRRQTFQSLHLYCHTQHISLPFPLSIYAQRQAGGRADGRAGFFVCCSICLTHVTALIYARDERAGGNGRFPARWCDWEKRYISFQGGDQWH